MTKSPAMSVCGKGKGLLLLLALLLFCAAVQAATYLRVAFKDFARDADAIVIVQVTGSKVIAPAKPGDYPTTQITAKVLNTHKGKVGESVEIVITGGEWGGKMYSIPDGPDLKINQEALLFLDAEQAEVNASVAPHVPVRKISSLGMGQYNLVKRDGKTFVESILCGGAVLDAGKFNLNEVDAQLNGKSVPLDLFTSLLTDALADNAGSGVKDGSPVIPAASTAAVLALETKAVCATGTINPTTCYTPVLKAKQNDDTLAFALLAGSALFLFVLVVLTVRYLRKHGIQPGGGTAALFGLGAFLLGSMLAPGGVLAFVRSGPIWNLDENMNGKVAHGRILWRENLPSKNSIASFEHVTNAFNEWENVTNSRLAFAQIGSTSVTGHGADSVNLVTWDTTPPSDFSKNVLGITYTVFFTKPSSVYIDGDIIFNDRDTNWNASLIKGVSLHEIGHFVGLAHTSTRQTVMFPTYAGLTKLSSDETEAARSLYPGEDNTTPIPSEIPVAKIAASPRYKDMPPMAVNFDATASITALDNKPLVSYEWNYGDGTTDSGTITGHNYTSLGTYTVVLTVTDSVGRVGQDSITISCGTAATRATGSLKLFFTLEGKDTFSVVLESPTMTTFSPVNPLGATVPFDGEVYIGSYTGAFQYLGPKRKSSNKTGPIVSVSKTKLTLKLSKASLRQTLLELGVTTNTNKATIPVNVPVRVWFGEGANLQVYTTITFQYKSDGKTGSGNAK